MLRRNAEWKLAALLIAFLLWAYITVAQQTGERSFRAQITLPEAPPGFALLTPSKQDLQATVVLRGDQESLEMAVGQVQATVALPEKKIGKVDARVIPTFPRTLSQVRVIPQVVSLRLERMIQRKMRVICQLTGEPSPGYVLGTPRVSPRIVTVVGAESAVKRVQGVCVRIDTSYAVLGQPQSGLLAAQDVYGRDVPGVRVIPVTATVIVPVQNTIASRLLPVFVPIVGTQKEGFRVAVSVDPPLVTAAGEADKVRALPSVSSMPLVLDGASASFRRRLKLIVPNGVASLSETTVTVKVNISPRPTAPPAQKPVE